MRGGGRRERAWAQGACVRVVVRGRKERAGCKDVVVRGRKDVVVRGVVVRVRKERACVPQSEGSLTAWRA